MFSLAQKHVWQLSMQKQGMDEFPSFSSAESVILCQYIQVEKRTVILKICWGNIVKYFRRDSEKTSCNTIPPSLLIYPPKPLAHLFMPRLPLCWCWTWKGKQTQWYLSVSRFHFPLEKDPKLEQNKRCSLSLVARIWIVIEVSKLAWQCEVNSRLFWMSL